MMQLEDDPHDAPLGEPVIGCFVDDLGAMQYEVQVWAQKPYDYRFHYYVKGTSYADAAAQGKALFRADLECLGPREGLDDDE